MKQFLNIVFFYFLLSPIYVSALGAGVILIKYNQRGDLEVLMVEQSNHPDPVRQGLEFPSGQIGDHRIDNLDINNPVQVNDPKRLLPGAIREMLEESVCAPVTHSILAIPGQPYDVKNKTINQLYLKSAIKVVVNLIEQNGFVFLHKNKVRHDKPVGGDNQYALFFWNVTDVCNPGLLEAIARQRQDLIKKGFTMHGRGSIGAEPDVFAWVPATELMKVINNFPGDRSVQASKIVDSAGRVFEAKNGQNTIRQISTVCLGMIRDRDRERSNNQPNELNVDDGQSSSMRAVLNYLLTATSAKSNVAAQPAPAPVPQPRARSRSASAQDKQSRARSQSAKPKPATQSVRAPSEDDLLKELASNLDSWEEEMKVAILNKAGVLREALSYLDSMPLHLKNFVRGNDKATSMFQRKYHEVGDKLDFTLRLNRIVLVVRAIKNAIR